MMSDDERSWCSNAVMQTDKVDESVPSTVVADIETIARGGVLSDNDDQVEVIKAKLHRMMMIRGN